MVLRRPVLGCLLLYVTLDLCIAAIPGAFVFEPGASVEGTNMGRGRPARDVALLPAPQPNVALPAPPRVDGLEAPRPVRLSRRAGSGVIPRLPRAALADPSGSEDPQPPVSRR